MQIINSDGKTAITYPYTPNGPAAYMFLVIFGLGTLFHIIWLFRFRAAYFIPFIIGGICETFGYFGRSWSSRDQPNVRPYVLQYLLILPAPIFLAATIYMSLGRMATALDATKLTMIRPSRLTKLFVFLDVLCFVVQIAGAGMESTISSNIGEIGGKVVTAGVILQIFFTAWFVGIVLQFKARLQRRFAISHEYCWAKWRLYLSTLWISGLLIMLRNIVRAIQELQGFDGYVNSHEAFAYIFDALPMAIVVWIFVFYHPNRFVLLAREGIKITLPTSTPFEETKVTGLSSGTVSK